MNRYFFNVKESMQVMVVADTPHEAMESLLDDLGVRLVRAVEDPTVMVGDTRVAPIKLNAKIIPFRPRSTPAMNDQD
ncbi:hypothetical protein [Castellaniella sp.]|uniref:hypothetical protein n=1 Tax=Castellaniella sp. TaxID=1955812 RepID=UPI002AFFD9F8|nr:hypothetical protein [Castellaniella sp.]